MAYNSDFDDVQDELHRIGRENKNNRNAIWVVIPVMFVMHAVLLWVVVWTMSWVFGSATAVIVVTCAAYVSAVMGWAVYRVQQRSDQMAVYATSVHDEVLKVKEQTSSALRKL